MMRSSFLIAAAIAFLPVVVQAETIRLTPEQAEAAIESGAARQAKKPEYLQELPQPDRAIHGEVGVAIGTGGYRSIYGVVGVPLGDSGEMVLAYNQERGRGYYYGPGYDLGPINVCRSIDSTLCYRR
jgi:hypothetical protein